MVPKPTGFALLYRLPRAEQWVEPFEKWRLQCLLYPDQKQHYNLAKGIADLIDLLESDDDGRISTESYEPLNNYMSNNDSLFDSTNRNELMPLINFRKWIEAYWMWSRTSPGHEYSQGYLGSLVSGWMDEVARSAMPTSSNPLATVLSVFDQDARSYLESNLSAQEQSTTTAGLDTYSRS